MRPRTLELRGLPAALLLGFIAIVAVAVIALVLMVGAAVVVGGLAISAVAALYYAVRRKLSAGTRQDIWLEPEEPSKTTASLEVREIEVEVLPQRRD